MAEYESRTTVGASEQALFDYLADVGNLPTYFSRMTSARPGELEEVHTTARMPDGTEVEGDAWFRADEAQRTIEWGSEGPSDYSGRLEVNPAGEEVEVVVHLTTSRVGAGDAQVQEGIDETLATIKRLVEGQGVARQ